VIQLRCPCGALYQVPDDWAGRVRRCRACGADSTVPPAGTKVPIVWPDDVAPRRDVTKAALEVDFVTRAREVLGWTQGRLAREAGVGRSLLAMIEAGERRMTDEVAARIEAAFAAAIASQPPAPGSPDHRRTCNRCGAVRNWTVPLCPACVCPEFSVPRSPL
jgi:DNA-binding XRE family transcriptional regulator